MISLTRRALLLSASLWTAAATVGATGLMLRPARADTTEPPDQPLRELHTALEAAMRAGNQTTFPSRFEALAPVVDQVFDLKTVLRVSVGPRWDGMGDEIQTRLLKVYRRFTVATYVASFDKYDGERFQVLPGTRGTGADRIVGTEIVLANGEHIRLDYVMRDDSGTWRIVDVLLDGSISRVAVQRSDFRRILAGGDPVALIASLRRKIADLSGGALNS